MSLVEPANANVVSLIIFFIEHFYLHLWIGIEIMMNGLRSARTQDVAPTNAIGSI